MNDLLIRALDPAAASFETEIGRWYDAYLASLTHAGSPASPYRFAEIRDLASVVSGHRWCGAWLATRGDAVVGTGWLDLPTADNLHMATADVQVVPSQRRQGVGSALAAALEEFLRSRGRTVVVAEVDYGVDEEVDAVGGLAKVPELGDRDAILAPLEALERHVRDVRPGADLVILTIHWGPNMRPAPSEAFVRFAHRMVEAGVDVLHGHSAHVFQAVEVYRGRLILYDTGDFVDDYAVDEELRNDRSFLYLLRADRDGVRELELVPVLISKMQVNRARGRDREGIARRMRALSEPFGTRFEERGEGLTLRLK